MSATTPRRAASATATRVRVHNDLDGFEIMVKVSPRVRPGQFIIYHAWENYQFRGRRASRT